MGYKTKYYTGEIVSWLMVNLILPMALPICILLLANILVDLPKDAFSIFLELMKNGLYIFSGITLLFSIFQDYSDASVVVKPVDYLCMMFFLGAMAIMFISSTDIIAVVEKDTFARHFDIFVWLFTLNIIFSLYLKVKLLMYQFSKERGY